MKTHTVLNTRPAHQSENLTHLLKKAGCAVFQLPIFKIQPIAFDPIKTGDFDHLIFLSANAVRYFCAHNTPNKLRANIVAIGPATKQTLHQFGYPDVICPEHFSSDGVLDMPSLQNIHRQSVLIISGKNSKSLLKTTLKKRGALIKAISCYQRKPILYSMKTLFPEMVKNEIDVVISTSFDSFGCLMRLFKSRKRRDWLLSKTLCIINDKMKVAALKKGFHSVIQADNATDEMIFEAIGKIKS